MSSELKPRQILGGQFQSQVENELLVAVMVAAAVGSSKLLHSASYLLDTSSKHFNCINLFNPYNNIVRQVNHFREMKK